MPNHSRVVFFKIFEAFTTYINSIGEEPKVVICPSETPQYFRLKYRRHIIVSMIIRGGEVLRFPGWDVEMRIMDNEQKIRTTGPEESVNDLVKKLNL